MIIRQIDAEDAEKYLTLNKKLDESGFMLYKPGERQTTVEQQAMMIKRVLSDEHSTILVAESDQQIVGFIGAIGNSVERKKHCAYLALGVAENHRGNGLATELFNHVFAWAKATEMTRLELTVIQENTKAVSLYKKLGFIIEGEKINSLMVNGQAVNEYYMYKIV